MTNSILTRWVALSALLVLCPAKGPAKEYVLTVGSEQPFGSELRAELLRFVPQGEKGYVVKQASRKPGISTLAGTLFLEEGQVRPIGGLDRHGIWIIENDGPASKNDAVMTELIRSGAAEYVATLFSSNGETVAVIPEIVIRVHPGVDATQVHLLCESMALAIIKPMEFTTQEYLLQVLGPDAESVFTALENLNNVEWIEWAAPNTASQPKLAGQSVSLSQEVVGQFYAQAAGQTSSSSGVIPNDEYFPRQWHLHNTGQSGGMLGADIRAPEAWEITTGDPNVIVAVLDMGVDLNHPDIIDSLVPGYDFSDGDEQPYPSLDDPLNAHGTACAGLIAAQGNNGIGVTGVTWDCKIMPIRILRGVAGPFASMADIATAFRWAAAHGADVLSDSTVGYTSDQPVLHSAIVDVTKADGIGRDGKGCVFIVAAGNIYWKYPEVVAVGASNHNDVRCSYSSYGPELDIVSPSGQTGAKIWTTDIAGSVGFNNTNPDILDYTDKFTGTSAACPIAAGVAALILSVEPTLTSDDVRHFLERSAKDLGDPGRDDYYGWGRVDARAALDMVLAKRADLNNDWRVDLKDFALLAEFWKTSESSADIAPAKKRDGTVDIRDVVLMAEYWLKQIP